MPLSLLNHSALALFAQRTRIPTSARSIGFCAIWVCISSSSGLIGLSVRCQLQKPLGGSQILSSTEG
jgi:hypothetical protein